MFRIGTYKKGIVWFSKDHSGRFRIEMNGNGKDDFFYFEGANQSFYLSHFSDKNATLYYAESENDGIGHIANFVLSKKTVKLTPAECYQIKRALFGIQSVTESVHNGYNDLFIQVAIGSITIHCGAFHTHLTIKSVGSLDMEMAKDILHKFKPMVHPENDNIVNALTIINMWENPATLDPHNSFYWQAQELPGSAFKVKEGCPDEGNCGNWKSKPISLQTLIIHLNDDHKWDRSRIADWLESIHDPTGANGPNLNFGEVQ